MKKHFLAVLMLAAALWAFALAAAADQARVITPGGPVNMRKTADDKGRIVVSVPNRSMVEVTEEGDEWCAVTYKKKHGYIRTEFLRLPGNLPGMTVWPDEGTLLLYDRPQTGKDDAPDIVAAAPCSVPVLVIAAEDGWVQAELNGVRGWARTDRFTWQRSEPAAGPDWIALPGVLTESAAGVGDRGDPVTVGPFTSGKQKTALVRGADGVWTEIPQAMVALTAPGDRTDAPEEAAAGTAVSWPEAEEAARKALTRKAKTFAKEEYLIPVTVLRAPLPETGGPAWECAFVSASGQYRYAAVVDAETGEVLVTADCTAFAEPLRPGALLDTGEVRLSVSAETLAVGEVLDCSVIAWTDHACAWTLTGEGVKTVSADPGPHFSAAWRPRAAGVYTLTVTVTDAEKNKGTASAVITVDGELPAADGTEAVYSQKDGWWRDKAYRDSDLEKSGCAIFALSHALHLRGHFEPDTEPAALAKRHALCLTPTGTNNERLIREAGRRYGFRTEAELITDRRDIVRRLRAGELFSFSIARGHIALVSGVSDDGTMVRVIDSAPSATYERIKGSALYVERAGRWIPALTPDDIPGARWYFETGGYGGMTYWLELGYVAGRGVRMIGVEEETPATAEAQ